MRETFSRGLKKGNLSVEHFRSGQYERWTIEQYIPGSGGTRKRMETENREELLDLIELLTEILRNDNE